jgi:hypothetical protein
MNYRKLRIAFTAACGALCLLLIVLWVRSYSFEDRASGHVSWVGMRLYSSRGWLVLFRNDARTSGPYDWDVSLASEYWLQPGDTRLQFSLPVSFLGGPTYSNVSIPHWAAILAVLVAAPIPWIHWPPRFSLRTLLIASTLMAVFLGLIVMMLRRS